MMPKSSVECPQADVLNDWNGLFRPASDGTRRSTGTAMFLFQSGAIATTAVRIRVRTLVIWT